MNILVMAMRIALVIIDDCASIFGNCFYTFSGNCFDNCFGDYFGDCICNYFDPWFEWMNEFFICKKHIHAIAIKQIYTHVTQWQTAENNWTHYISTTILTNYMTSDFPSCL
jgi:hypothetical protein